MLTFFVDPYEEEMISSLFARYHFYSGNTDKRDTLEELLGEREIRAFKLFPSRLKYLESQIDNPNYTNKYFIYKHTLFPLYATFLSKDKHNEVIEYMRENGSDKIHHVLGISTSKVDVRRGYKYCPLCVEDDIDGYGEAYFHRIHQMQGILVCEKHMCKLYDYECADNSDKEFVIFNNENVYAKEPTFYKKSINDKLIIIAKIAKYILNIEYLKYSREDIVKKTKIFLDIKGYLTESGIVRQAKLMEDFNNYYDKDLLKLLNLERTSWIRGIFHVRGEIVHPIKHILLIYFLVDKNIGEFFCEIEEKEPFGKGPWPCLNPICKKYNKKVIKNVEIKNAYKSRLLNGIFKCEFCDYTYRRKGPDKLDSDIYKKNKVLDYGQMWEDEFVKCIERGDKKTDIEKRMGVYHQFIEYYMEHKQFKPKPQFSIEKKRDNFEEYTNDIKEYIKKNPTKNKTMIAKEMVRQVAWLRCNNPEWLEKNLPKARKFEPNIVELDYNKIDLEICKNIEMIYKELMELEKPRRITLSLIEKLAKTNIYRRLDKLPKAKIYLDSVLESVDEFRARRVQAYCDRLIREKKYKTRTKVLQDTSILLHKLSSENLEEINSIIEKYHYDIISSE